VMMIREHVASEGTPHGQCRRDVALVAQFNSSGVINGSIRVGGTSFIDIGNAIEDGTSFILPWLSTG